MNASRSLHDRLVLLCTTVAATAHLAVASPNLIPHAGFDTGVYRRWRTAYQSGCVIRDADLDSEQVHDGAYSLRMRAYARNFAPTPLGTEAESAFFLTLADEPRVYTLSAWVRCEVPMRFNLACGPLAINELLAPQDGWRRVQASGKLTGPQRIKLAVRSDRLLPEHLHGGEVWVDSLQLEAGADATPWQPPPIEAGLVVHAPFSVFHTNEPVRVTLHIAGKPPSKPCRVHLTPRIYDAFGNTYSITDAEITLNHEDAPLLQSEHAFDIPSDRTGVFRLVVDITGGAQAGLDDCRLEAPFYVLPPADPKAWNPIGLYAQMNRPMIELAGRLNLFWNNLLSSAGEMTEWHKVWKKGEMTFEHFVPRLQWAAKHHQMRFIGCLGPSSILDRLPADVLSDAPREGATLTLSHAPLSIERRHLRIDALRTFLQTAAEAYRPHVALWQIVDECTFPTLPYTRLCAESGRALRAGNPDAKTLATYPVHMAHAWLRAGADACGGLYDLGRTPERAQATVDAAALAGPDFPIYFYDCSINFSYLSDTFNGWGKVAQAAPVASGAPDAASLDDFMTRLDAALSRQIHPLGTAGRHARALCLYHARMPGGLGQCATDAWGHPAPLLVACGIFNALAPGGSLGPIPLDHAHAYRFSRGPSNGELIALHAKGDTGARSLDLAGLNGVRALDIWGNAVGDGLAPIPIATNRWFYLALPGAGLAAVTARLQATFGATPTVPVHWPVPQRQSALPTGDGPMLHIAMDDARDGTLRDASPARRTVTGVPADALTDGMTGRALDTARAQPRIPDDDALAVGDRGLTVCCWIRPSTHAARWAGFVKKDARAPGEAFEPTAYRPFIGWNLGTQGSGGKPLPFEHNSFRFDIAGEGGGGRVTAGPISLYAATNRWTHVAATYTPAPDDRGLRLFVNGVLVADSVVVNLPRSIDHDGPLTIGRDLTPFDGAIDNVRVYGRALGQAEIAAIVAREQADTAADVAPAPAPW